MYLGICRCWPAFKIFLPQRSQSTQRKEGKCSLPLLCDLCVLCGKKNLERVSVKREKPIAHESQKTKRAREKLIKQLDAERAQVTPKALGDTVEKIHKWIADNSKHRVPIKGKSIKLFNQNKDAARISKKVRLIAERLSLEAKDLFS